MGQSIDTPLVSQRVIKTFSNVDVSDVLGTKRVEESVEEGNRPSKSIEHEEQRSVQQNRRDVADVVGSRK